MKLADLEIKTFVNSDFEENLYTVRIKGSSECAVIDPGMMPERAIDYLRTNQITPRAILITHGHYDHIGGLDRMKAEWKEAEILVGKLEASKLTDPAGNLSLHFGFPVTTCPADRTLADEEDVTVAGITFKVLYAPGHSSGHVVYLITAEDGAAVFVGDVIFAGSIGRTDFPDGDTNTLLKSIKTRLLTLPDDTILFTGHGPSTKVGREKAINPWL